MPDQLSIFEQDLTGLDPDEAAVWRVIRERRGRESAVSARALSEATGLRDVEIRHAVRALIMERGRLIASAVSKPAGFYIASTPEEIKEATRSLRHRGVSILARAARLQKLSIEEIFRQTVMEFDNANSPQ